MFTIRPAHQRSDYEAAFTLVEALALFEKAPHEVTLTAEQFVADGMANPPLYRLLVAEETATGRIVGNAVFYIAYGTWKGKMVYLDDLMVHEEYRQRGIGQQLMEAVWEVARQENANQVRWQVLDWNTPAIRFYEKLGVKLDGEWINCAAQRPLLYQKNK